MNKFLLATASVGAFVGASAVAFAADETARVISATPVTQQVGVPRQACATYATPGVAPQCSTQTIYESRTVAYNVVYESGGKQYSVQMPQNPGRTLRLGTAGAPVAAVPMPAPTAVAATSAVSASDDVVEDPAMTNLYSGFTQPYPPPVQVTYAYPGANYYGSSYDPSYGSYGSYGSYWGPGLTLGFIDGYYYGGGRHYGGRGHGHGQGHGHGHRR